MEMISLEPDRSPCWTTSIQSIRFQALSLRSLVIHLTLYVMDGFLVVIIHTKFYSYILLSYHMYFKFTYNFKVFRRVHKISNNDCWLCHFCLYVFLPSVCVSA